MLQRLKRTVCTVYFSSQPLNQPAWDLCQWLNGLFCMSAGIWEELESKRWESAWATHAATQTGPQLPQLWFYRYIHRWVLGWSVHRPDPHQLEIRWSGKQWMNGATVFQCLFKEAAFNIFNNQLFFKIDSIIYFVCCCDLTFFKEINTLIQQGHIKLIKRNSKNIYNVANVSISDKYYCFKRSLYPKTKSRLSWFA